MRSFITCLIYTFRTSKTVGVTILVLVGAGVMGLSPPLMAQETTTELNEPAESLSTSSSSQLSTDLETTQQRYREQLEAYRSAEHDFVVARGQLEQLNTLVALENAVKATQQAMVVRGQVLETYLELLIHTLEQTEGIEAVDRHFMIQEMRQTIERLRSHRVAIEMRSTRQGVAESANEFVEVAAAVQRQSYQALSNIAVSRLRAVHLETVNYADELEQATASSGSGLQQAARARAFSETRNSMALVADQLDVATRTMVEQQDRASYNSYSQVLRALNPVYSRISQIMGFLTELRSL